MEQCDHSKIDALYQLIADISDPEDIRALFDDLCTRKEIENMAERVFAARLLMEGKPIPEAAVTHPLQRKLNLEIMTRMLQPKVIVEYERITFI